MNTTYQELLDALKELTPEQLKMTATVFVRGVDEYYPVQTFGVGGNDQSVLDEGHPYLLV